MTTDEANKIFQGWKEYQEINDKLWKIFTDIPESFLPYPKEILEEALNIVAKNFFDEGDHKTSDLVKGSIAMILKYKDDEEAIKAITDSLILKDPKLRKLYLRNLKRARDSWTELKK